MPRKICKVCRNQIEIIVNRGEDYCSENCKKILEKQGDSNHARVP